MKKKNFTLVELLCATALVVILAGIGFSAYSYASHRGKEAATKSLITRIAAGLETLKTKHGFYPASSSYKTIEVTVNNNTGLITGISFGGTSVSDAKQLKDFLAVVDGENLKKYLVEHSDPSLSISLCVIRHKERLCCNIVHYKSNHFLKISSTCHNK